MAARATRRRDGTWAWAGRMLVPVLFASLACGCSDPTGDGLETKATFSGTSRAGPAATTHACTGTAADEGATCDDGDPCTRADRCEAGTCAGDKTGLRYGAVTSEEALALAAVPGGGFALAGYTSAAGAGLTDMWLVRTDAQGRRLWDRSYGSPASDQASAVLALQDGFVLAGFRDAGADLAGARMWLVRTDAQGIPSWDAAYGGAGSTWADAVVARSGGGFALAGSAIAPGASQADGSLVAVDAHGKLLWDQPIGGAKDDGIHALAAWNEGYVLAGFTASQGAGKTDGWLVRTSPTGAVLWQQTYGGSQNDELSALTVLADGFALAGFTQSMGHGKSDLWLVRTDAAGKSLWAQAYGSAALDGARGVTALPDGTFALAGDTAGTADVQGPGGTRQSWLLRVDAHGGFLSERTYGPDDADSFANAIVPVPGAGFALAGGTRGEGGTYDMWLVRADADGISTCD